MSRLRTLWRRAPLWLKGAAAAALIAPLILGGAVKYSESPAFCKSCHIMHPYYQAWESSKHNSVSCVECHYPPGSAKKLLWKKFQALSQVAKYVTRTYSSRPFAEVEDAACLRCHSTRLLEGKLITKRGIRFDHRPHIAEPRRGRQLRCVSCHSQVVVGKHIEVTYDTCYLCHFRGGEPGRPQKPKSECLDCHTLPQKSFSLGDMSYNHRDFVTRRGVSCRNCHLDVIRGEGKAEAERCFTCHNDPAKLARYGDTPFLHERHVTERNIACFHCHREIQHGLSDGNGKLPKPGGEGGPAAPDGHPRTLAFDCAFCHENKHGGQLALYTGKTRGLGLPEMPSPMYLAQVDCVGCHDKGLASGEGELAGRDFKASEKACTKCHGPKFQGIWEETGSLLSQTLARLSEKLEKARASLALKTAGDPAATGARPAIERAEKLLRYVRGARGEHNIYLASKALRDADDELGRAAQALEEELPDLSALSLLSGTYCATLCHERLGVKSPPETVLLQGKAMPHARHGEMLACAQCHEIGGHKRMPLRKNYREKCLGCHPQ